MSPGCVYKRKKIIAHIFANRKEKREVIVQRKEHMVMISEGETEIR